MEQQVTDRKALIETLNAAFLRDELEDELRRYWSIHVLEAIRPGENPLDLIRGNRHVWWRLVLEPVEAFIAGSDQPAEKFVTLKKEDSPTFLCNRLFRAGDLIYSCRDCAVDSSCVLCVECFKQSSHKNHRYEKLEASGNRYCGCGNLKLWRNDFACVKHEPSVDLKDVNFNLEDARIRVPKDMSRRFTETIRHALCYVYQVLTFRDGVPIPPDLACPSNLEDPFPFVTILYKDEVRRFIDVIKTLILPSECTQNDAFLFAFIVDLEGRSPVKFGSESECERVKKFVERDLEKQEPLRLDVVQTAAYAHQIFALEVLTWIQGLAEKCEGFRALICDVCLQASSVGGDYPVVSTFLLEDARLWKAARRSCYSLFMATFLTFNNARIEFSRLLAGLYTQLTTAFISDNHDYDYCVYNLTVQLFSFPAVARALFSDGLVEDILKSFVLFCQHRMNNQGRLSFDKATRPATVAQFNRALYTLDHAEKLLRTVSPSDQWTDALRKGFIGTFEQFLQIMVVMEGMDGHTRSAQSYVEYETDWKPAFNMQFCMGSIVDILQQWCASDNKILSVCTEKLLTATLASLHAIVTSHAVTSEEIEKIVKIEKKEVGGCFFDCVEYDVSTQFVSIHYPVIRMLTGLVVPALAKRIVLEVSGVRMPIEEHLKLHARELLELPLRTMVLVAQARREMWRRNGDALYDQILNYQHPRWRREMLDKDIVMMQACAAVMPPDSFFIALLDKFALIPWTDETFDARSICAEDDSIGQVMCLAEDFLHGLIVLVGERFYPSVGRVTEEDCLKNEVIHQLCKDDMCYSELLKYLPDQEANSSLDEVIKEVAVLKEPSPTLDDFYELKAELTERFNLFFYHYDGIEYSKAKDTQRKQRKKTWLEVVFAPPCPPPFSDAFSRIVHLLDCDVFIHLLKLTVRRALINHPRFLFDDQLVRMLYLVGYALHEEKRQRLSNNNNDFKFLEKAADAGVFKILRELRVRSHNEAYKNLLEWMLHFYDDLTKKESMDTTEAPLVDSGGDTSPYGVLSKVTAVPYKPVQEETTSSADEDLMQLSSASVLQQVTGVDGSSDIATMTIGVDFGAAQVRVGQWIGGRFEKISYKSGEDAIPAFFLRKDGRDFFGQEARKMSTIEPANVIFDIMQFVGLDLREAYNKIKYGMYPFEIRIDHREFVFQLHDGSTVSPLEVIHCFLEHVHIQCKSLFGPQQINLALTVPSHWEKSNYPYDKKAWLLDTARRSGFKQVSLIDSQVAVMLGCYLGMKGSKTWIKDILVVDIGATDITATVSRTQLEDETETKTFTVTGIGLGCASVDQALMRYLKDQFVIKHRLPLETTIEIISWHRLRMECEKARVCLSSALMTALFVPNFAVGYDLHVELTRNTFDDVVGSTIAEDVVGITEAVLARSEINVELSTKDDFRLFLVGGGSHISCIQQRMAAVFTNKTDYVALQPCGDAAVIGAAGYARMIALEPDIMKLDIVHHYRDLYDFFENNETSWEDYSNARLASCRSACIHVFARRTLGAFERMVSIIPSMQSTFTKTNEPICRFSIKYEGYAQCYVSNYINTASLQNIELTQATAASLQLQQRHMTILSFKGTLEQEDLTNTGAFGNCEGRMTMVCNPLDLCHPNVVRCLAVGRTSPMCGQQCFTEFSYWQEERKFIRVLLDMQLKDDSLDLYSLMFPGLDITLHDFCKERGSSLGNKEIINKTKQLLDGLLYLHGLEIPFILASLTSFGILVTPDGESVKILDILFGLLDRSPSQLFFNVSLDFTNDLLAYAHPDVSNYILEVSQYHEKCSTLTFQPYMDIWSLGCVMLDMLSRGDHFSCINRNGIPLDSRTHSSDFVRAMMNGGVPLIPSSTPDVIRQLCTKCFERKPDHRADARGLLVMISQIPETEIDVCNTNESRPKQTSLFTVSKDV